MRRVRIEMLKSRDQLQARECYNLPLDMAAELIARGEARDHLVGDALLVHAVHPCGDPARPTRLHRSGRAGALAPIPFIRERAL